MVYEIKCSWCGKHMGTKEDAGSEFAEKLKQMGLPIISHSICPKCRKAVDMKYGLNKKGGSKNG
ncbi:MAG: hypothetical protein K8S18_08090 [Desulfobacula sp.]|nr:hypothetical protein [Desulfobacula sp.]